MMRPSSLVFGVLFSCQALQGLTHSTCTEETNGRSRVLLQTKSSTSAVPGKESFVEGKEDLADSARDVELTPSTAHKGLKSIHTVKELKGQSHFWFQSKFPEPGYYADEPFIQGPTQVDDLGFLFAIIKELRPATLVEIGSFRGDSAKIFLSAIDDDQDAKLFSFDPYPQPQVLELQAVAGAGKFAFFNKSGEQMDASDVERRQVDFAFIDASHVFESNQRIWKTLSPLLSDTAVVAVHDTGFWSKGVLDKAGVDASWRPGKILGPAGKHYYLHPNHVQERKFVNWITESYPSYEAMHFHTLRYLRNGVTLLQKKFKLDTDSADLKGSSDAKTISDGCDKFQGQNFLCDIEKPEHELVRRWIPKTARVLELGARFGTTTCAIAKQLGNSGKLVAVEPDPTVWFDLQKNLDSNNCQGHVMQGIVSDKPAYLPGFQNPFYNLRSSESDTSGIRASNLAFNEIEEQLGFKFDTLLIDCEGCLPTVMKHLGTSNLERIKTIVLEGDMPVGAEDCTENCVDYDHWSSYLRKKGFHMVDRINDCDKAAFGGNKSSWCGKWIWHYAFVRRPEPGVFTQSAGKDDDSIPHEKAALLHESAGRPAKRWRWRRGSRSRSRSRSRSQADKVGAGKGDASIPYDSIPYGKASLLHEPAGSHVAGQAEFGSQSVTNDAAYSDRLNAATVEVVASHFDEDLNWVNLYQSQRVKFSVYSKSTSPPAGTIPLPNLGREGHTFLYHIVQHYDDLAPWTVFTQAVKPKWGYYGPGQQSGHLSDDVLFDDYLQPFPEQKDSFFVFDCVSSYPSGMALMRTGFLVHDLHPSALTKSMCPARGAKGWSPWWFDADHKARLLAEQGMSKWYHEFIAQDVDDDQPLALAFAQSGRFAVSRGRIQLRPREYYAQLLAQLSGNPNPIQGYWLEASWFDIFHPELLQSKSPACDYPGQPASENMALPVEKLAETVRETARKDGLLL